MEPSSNDSGANGNAFSEVPDLLPARMLNEYAYCPRLFFIEWSEGLFADNEFTVEGRVVHRRVDRPGGYVPAHAQGDSAENGDDSEGTAPLPEACDPERPIAARSLLLSSSAERLIARLDLLEGQGTRVTPVDYKRGAKPDLPEGAYEPERVQLCAQGLILRANGFTTEAGQLYFAESRARVTIAFDEKLVARTRALAAEALATAAAGAMPPPLVDSPKCPACSLVGICLPDEVNLLRLRPEVAETLPPAEEKTEAALEEGPAAPDEPERVRRLIAPRPECLPFYVQAQGRYLSLHGDVIQVMSKGVVEDEVRVRMTSQVNILGAVQFSTQTLRALLENDIPLALFSYGGWFYGIARGFDHKNVHLRLAQFRAAEDSEKSLAIARTLVSSKIRNCRVMLRRNHAAPPDDVLRGLRDLASKALAAQSPETLLGIEGSAARVYFEHFAAMLRPRDPMGAPPGQRVDAKGGNGSADNDAFTFDMNGRNRRPPRDPVNALLSFAYAMLTKEWTLILHGVGFDPYLGFFHRPRYGRPALALDLMEEFRPIIADSVVLWAVNNGVVTASDFERRAGGVALKANARKAFIRAYEHRMDELVTHPVFDYRLSYRRLLDVQARLLGRYLLGEVPDVPRFVVR